ncbi:MAG: type I DNA topoisomerase [Anaerolineaceae bacterium]|nr:type I DNA topoisomerase [Anaerolineaceae bacterium]
MEAYCVKCREKRDIFEATAAFNAVGAPVTKGICPVCGTKVYRMGKTPAHESLEKPVIQPKTKQRKGKLVIVESPAKAKTVGRFLGKDFMVRASVGHIRDLLKSQLSVDVENDFQPKYRVPNEKKTVVKELKALAGKAEKVYLATDPDREGEAIAWHLMEAAAIEPSIIQRVVFHEITNEAVTEAFANPRSIDMDLVNAQQARRILDRLVGYGISPILWVKVRSRLSAGRVQSVALRLIVEREREIDAFNPVEFWTIAAEFLPEGGKTTYIAKLYKVDSENVVLSNEMDANGMSEDMRKSEYFVDSIKRGQRTRRPSAPFITSTLQQDSSRKLGFTTKKTMAVSQQLYEGIDVGESGVAGLITYMRTDSTHIADQAVKEARDFIRKRYGDEFLPAKSPIYKTRTVAAQEAHEAIRPTSIFRQPEGIKEFLTRDQYRLYKLIWQRLVASQMESAVYDTLTIEVNGKGIVHTYMLRATGSKISFQGYLIAYQEGKDEDVTEDEENSNIPIDDIKENQKQILQDLISEQHFTQPPPRFTEASLIQLLEENGIGRPSTYASIISTIQARGYVIRESKRLFPTEIGFTVNDLIVEYFPDIVDTGFTSSMENHLDMIAEGSEDWVNIIRDFYKPFKLSLDVAKKDMPEQKAELEKIDRLCPKCGKDLVIRHGRFGKFISCSGFPECRHTEAWLEKIGMICPVCKEGDVVERRTKKGRVFYGCSTYPECEFTSWKKPIPEPCPNCKGTLVISNKRESQCLSCEETFLLKDISKENQDS